METVNSIIENHENLNSILLKEIDAINLLMFMETTNRILVELEKTILRTHIGFVNSRLLSSNDVMEI